jgi:fibronectin-binding autotransporter adhesin
MGGIRRIGMAAAIVIGSVGTIGAATVVTATPSMAATCTDSWQGPTTGTTNWNASAANWSSGFPSTSSVVCIALAGTYTVDLTASVNVGTVQVGAASGTQTLAVDGSSTNVELGLASASTVSSHGVVNLAPASGFAWLNGPGVLTVGSGGTLSTTGAGNIAYLRTSVTNLSGGTVSIGAATTVQDEATTTSNSGTFTVTATGALTAGGGGSFVNSGTLNLTGTMSVGSDTFTQTSGSITGHAVVMTGSGTLGDTAGTGAFDVIGSINFSGTIPHGQTVTVDGAATNVELTQTSTVTDNGRLTLSPSSGFAMLIGSPLTIGSGGVFSTTGANNIAYLRADIANHGGGTITIGAADTVMDQANVLSNAGAFTVSASGNLSASGAGSFTNTSAMTVTGSMSVGSDTFTQTSGSISGNPVVMTGSGTLVDTAGTGAFDVIGSINASGTIPAGQTVTIDGSSTNVIFDQTSPITDNGTLTLAPSSGFSLLEGSPLTIGSGGVLSTTGLSNTAFLRADITNQAGGTITIGQADTRMDQVTTLSNAGTFTVSAGGNIVATGGGSFTNTSAMTVTGSMTVGSDTFTQTSGSISGHPVVMTGSGTLVDTAGTGAFDVIGSINASGTIPHGQTVTIDGSSTNVIFDQTSGITDNGTLALAPSSGFSLLEGSPLTIGSGGVLSTTGTANTAYLRANITNPAGGTITIGHPDTRMDSGTTTTNGGTLQVASGGHLTMSGGSILTTTGVLGTTVNATGPVTSGISGGIITAGGTFEATTIGSPAPGTVFAPISGATLSGAFTNLEYGAHGYTTVVNSTSVTITATTIPFSVTSKPVSPTAHEPANYSLATITTLLGSPTYTATINWGDSTSSAGTISAGTVTGRHSFAAPGPHTVVVTVHGSDGTTISSSKSIVVKADPVPTVTSVTPNVTAQGSSYTLSVAGTGLTDNAVPSFSATGVTVVSTTYVSPVKLTVKVKLAPTATVGVGNVTITTDGGAGTCTGCLTVDHAPHITTIVPVPAHGASTVLTVNGNGFQPGLVVTSTVPGATFGAVTGQTATKFFIQITIPGTTAPGAYKITVTNPDGGKVTKPITVS